MDPNQYDFTLLLDADELKIDGATYKVGKFARKNPLGIEEVYYKNQTYNIFIQKSDVAARLAKKKKKDKQKSKRETDYDVAKRNEDPFDVYDRNGIQCHLPRHLSKMLSSGTSADDDGLLKYWQSLATKFTGPDPAAGTKPEYRRFLLAPPEKGPRFTVYFTPLSAKATLGVNVTLLQTVIEEHEKEANGVYKKWKLVACSYAKANNELGLKLVGTNFLLLYHAWMDPADYAALWTPWNNPGRLPFPFPKNTSATVKMYEKIHENINVGTIPVNGTNITLRTGRMQSAAAQRSTVGDSGLGIMGVSATDLNKLWGTNAPKTDMHNSRSEWLHRSAFSFGGISKNFNIKSSDDPNNLIFGSAECNTDMIRAELVIKGLLAEYQGQHFAGNLMTTTIWAGKVTRKDIAEPNPTAELPTFLSAYPWLCFQLKYTFKMPKDHSPLGCVLNAEIKFDPWSLYVPLAIEPRMDTWLLSHLKAKLYKKPTKRSADHSFLDSVASSEMVEPEPSMVEPELDVVDKAWRAVEAGLEELVLPGLVIKNPTALVPPSDVPDSKDGPGHHGGPKRFPLPVDEETPLPSQGFVLQGGVELFGTSVVGQFEKWMGPLPEGVVPGIDPPRWERVTVPGDFHLSSILPPLKDTPYDFIKFRNVSFWHQNCEFDKTRSVGWHLDAEWVIGESCGVLYEVLRTILHVDVPVLQISAGLGWDQQWNAPFDVHSFTLEGVFAGLTLSPIKGLQLTSIGVRLLGIRGFELYPEPHTTLSYGFSIFGAMKIDVPGSLVPLDLHYDMGVESGFVNISAELSGEIWTNALGINNLTLEDVTFLTSFSLSSPWKSLSFSISASFWYLASQAIFSGQFSPGSGSFALSAQFDQFDLREIDTLFYTLFGDSLTLPDYDVHIGSAVLSIASGSGLSVALRDVQVAGHTAFDVAVSLSTSGVTLSGAVSSKRISFGEVHVRDASLEISFWTEKQKKKVDLMLTGTLEVDFLHATVTAAVHVYPGEKGIDWTVIAILSAQDKSIAISDIVPQIEKGSYLDLSLRNAMIVAASKDDPAATSLPLPRGCTVRQGIQVAAVIDSLPVLNDLLRGRVVSDLVLSAGWSKQTGFDLKILLPAATTLDFGSGIRSTPISLELHTTPLQLAVATGITVPVKESTPLKFTFSLDASLTKANATGEMDGWWEKPFGVENLKIGPTVGLTIGIDYKLFLATGTPTDFGVAAGLVIGKVPARFAMKISENPQDELLTGELKNLDIADVIAFGRDLVKADIPDIPDLLKFEELYLYICPFGVKFGTTVYPAGFSFRAALLFFKHRANIECTIDKVNRSIALNGGIDNFTLGPLTVRGANGPRAELKCELGLSKQQLVLDGVIKLFEAQVQTYVNLQFLPDPTLKFRSLVTFARILTYELNAELLGSSENLQDADFYLSSTFENHLIDYVKQQIDEQLEVAKTAATNGLQAAQQGVEDAKSKWHAYLNKTRSDFTFAEARWVEHEQNVRGPSQAAIDNWLNALKQLEGYVDDKRSTYDSILAEVRDAAEQSSRDRASATTKAREWVEEVTRLAEEENKAAQAAFNEADADRLALYKTIETVISLAEKQNSAAEWEVNNVTSTINEYSDAPAYHVFKKAQIPILKGKLLVLQGEKLLAQKAVDYARQAWNNVDYVQRAQRAEKAKKNWERVQQLGQGKVDNAKGDESKTDEETLQALNEAQSRWNDTKAGPEFVSWQNAGIALDAHRATKGSIFDVATDAIKGLVTSVEYVGYTTANALLQAAETAVDLPFDLASKVLKIAEDTAGTLSTVFKAIAGYGLNAIVIELITLSGTLRGAVGLGGPHSRPVTLTVQGRILGQSFSEKISFDLKDAAAFVKALFDRVWSILKNTAGDFLSGVLQKVTSVAKFAPTPLLPIADSSATELLALAVTAEERRLFEGFLPPAPSLRKHAFNPVWSDSETDRDITYFAPMIAVDDLPQPIPFSVARARFLEYHVQGTWEDAEQAKQRGLIAIPAGPFTTGPPM